MEGAARNLNLRPGKTAWNRKALPGMLPRIRTAATVKADQALRSVISPGPCSRWAMFTPDSSFAGIEIIPDIGLLFTNKNGDISAISETLRRCAAPISKGQSHIPDRFCATLWCSVNRYSDRSGIATERERQLTTARANQTTGLTNGGTANWAPEVEFSPFRALSRCQITFPFCC